MLIIALIIAVVAIAVLPAWWVKRILRKYETPRDDLPGTGGELANHLVKRFELDSVTVKVSEMGDHYQPQTKEVGLRPEVYEGKSLTAVATAAHEVGHAIQHAMGDGYMRWRTRLVTFSMVLNPVVQIAVIGMTAGSFLGAGMVRLALFVLICAFVLNIVIHVVTLPLEWEASYGKALPILEEGEYISQTDLKAVKRILFACAMTYVSNAILSVLNVGRWLRGGR